MTQQIGVPQQFILTIISVIFSQGGKRFFKRNKGLSVDTEGFNSTTFLDICLARRDRTVKRSLEKHQKVCHILNLRPFTTYC
jgi:hypothetical protein